MAASRLIENYSLAPSKSSDYLRIIIGFYSGFDPRYRCAVRDVAGSNVVRVGCRGSLSLPISVGRPKRLWRSPIRAYRVFPPNTV